MKKIFNPFFIVFVSTLFFLGSCSKEDTPVPLVANAGPDQTASVFSTVTLDGSASTGPEGVAYEWKYSGSPVPENEISLNVNGNTATFVPPKNGVYNFTLRMTQGSLFSDDQVVVTVSGFISLSGALTGNLILNDIEPDPTKPDYKITSELIIPSGLSMTTQTTGGFILIEVAETAGIIIDGGNFTQTAGTQILMTSSTGWKGILLKSGNLTLSNGTELQKGGKGVFTGQTETAAITGLAGTMNLTNVSCTSTTGYDLMLDDAFNSNASSITANNFTAAKPIKAPIAMLGLFTNNVFSPSQDYIVLTTLGAGTVATTSSPSGFSFQNNTRYYIDGDFTAGALVNFLSGATIYMKEGAGILVSGSQSSITITGGSATIDGLDNAPWKGIAVGGGAQMSLSGLTIKNAGSAVFNTGSFTSTQKAAVYYVSDNNANISNCQIIDSKGYGVYIDSPPGYYVSINNTTFTNPASPAIRALASSVHQMISSTTNTFTVPAGMAAVEVYVPNTTTSPYSVWQSLGGSNYYLFSGNVLAGSAPWTLLPGVNLKFKAGKSLTIGNQFSAIGTFASPITFDSESGTPGTWAGIMVQSSYGFEYCQIKNGGEVFMFKGGVTPATEKANLVFDYGSTITTGSLFKNNTISGSGGYGILVEATRHNPDALNVANSNAFSGNTSGDVIVK